MKLSAIGSGLEIPQYSLQYFLASSACDSSDRQKFSKSFLRKQTNCIPHPVNIAKGMTLLRTDPRRKVQQILVRMGSPKHNIMLTAEDWKYGVVQLSTHILYIFPIWASLSSQVSTNCFELDSLGAGLFFESYYCQNLNIDNIYSCRIIIFQMQDNERKEQNVEIKIEEECEPEPIIVNIDEIWISADSPVKAEYILCPVCYSIPIDCPVECASCERIFCQRDYDQIEHTTKRCPHCKSEPWLKKKTPHILFRKLFDDVVFDCQVCKQQILKKEQLEAEVLCKQQHIDKEERRVEASHNLEWRWTTLSGKELIEHLGHLHGMYLSENSILYDYSLVAEDGVLLKLNTFQNIEINHKRKLGLKIFQIAGNGGRIYSINLIEMKTSHHSMGLCRIIRERSESIRKGHKYYIWTAKLSNAGDAEQRFVFFSQDLQGIIERNYRDFEKNQRLNEFTMDVRESRFRISFSDMTQLNTFTKNIKPIERITLKYE